MTPRTFYNAMKGMFEKWETTNQAEWERTRWLACVTVNPHTKKNLQPKDLTVFPWEKKRNSHGKDYKQIVKEAELFKKTMEFNDKLKKQQNG